MDKPHWTDEFFTGQYAQEYFATAMDEEQAAKQAAFIAEQLGLDGSQRVLDLCCGNARHAIALSQQVKTIMGYDRTQLYLDAGQKRIDELGISNIKLVQGDMRELSYKEEFEAVYNYFTSWGYYSDEENLDVLRRIYIALKPGGRFLLETNFRDGLMRGYKPQGCWEYEDGTVLIEKRWFDFKTGRSHNRRLKIHLDGSREEGFYDHYLPSSDALIRHLKDSGFTSVDIMEAPTGGELTVNSWRLAAIAVK